MERQEMISLSEVSKQDLLELLESIVDGIDGIESEMGPEELNQYWDITQIDRARRLIDEVKGGSNDGRESALV